MMDFHKLYIYSKSLVAQGFMFWMFLWFFDVLGDSTWKTYSEHLSDILKTEVKLLRQAKENEKPVITEENPLNFSYFLWNSAAYICSMFVCKFTKFSHFCWIFHKVRNACKRCVVLLKVKSSARITTVERNTLTQNKPENSSSSYCNEVQAKNLIKLLNGARKHNLNLSFKLFSLKEENIELKKIIINLNGLREKLEKTSSLLRTSTRSLQELCNLKLKLVSNLQEVLHERNSLYNRLRKLEQGNANLKNGLEQVFQKDRRVKSENNNSKKVLRRNYYTERGAFLASSSSRVSETIDDHDKTSDKSNASCSTRTHLEEYLHQYSDTLSSLSNTTSSDENGGSAAFQSFLQRFNSDSHYYYQGDVF